MSTVMQFIGSTELQEWRILRLLDETLLNSLRIVQVFGDLGDSALLVTENDEVLALGRNSKGELGIGSRKDALRPIRVSQLCGKRLSGFSCGEDHCVAITETGKLFSWGRNDRGQIGTGIRRHSTLPLHLGSLDRVFIKEVASGGGHSLARTHEDKVFAWGSNCYGQCGIGSNVENVLQPTQVILAVPVSAVSCGRWHSAALTYNGKVYIWGDNTGGKLGLGHRERQNSPALVTALDEERVVKVLCGLDFTLALCSRGVVFAWGFSEEESLAVATSDPVVSYPEPVHALPRADDILCVPRYQLSCAKSSESIFYWGWTKEKDCLTTPMQTNYNDLISVFRDCEIPCCYVLNVQWPSPPVVIAEEAVAPIQPRLNLSSMFNQKENADLVIRIGNKNVYVHKVILRATCSHFKTVLSEPWFSDKQKELVIHEYTPKVYYAFLKYLYTQTVDKMEPQSLIELWHICDSYMELDLRSHCVSLFENSLTPSNVAQVYAQTSKLKSSELEERCSDFIMRHFREVVLSEGYLDLDPDLVKIILFNAAKRFEMTLTPIN